MPVSRKRKRKPTGGRISTPGRAYPSESPVTMWAESAERHVKSVLEYAKRRITARHLDEATGAALKTITNIGGRVGEFSLWLDESPEAQWLQGEE